MLNSNLKITYFFQKGRNQKIKSGDIFAKEMYYGYFYFKSLYENVKIIEFHKHERLWQKILFKFERIIRTPLRLPIYWSFITNYKNYRELKSSDFAIFTNNRVGSAALPMLVMAKFFKSKVVSVCFIMGLFSRKPRFKFLQFFHNTYLKLFINKIDRIIFLSEGEYRYAKNIYPNKINKFFFIPFCIDNDIWKIKKVERTDDILFVGNDGFRDYDFLKHLINNLPEINFNLVTTQINESELNFKNFNLFKGNWGAPILTDEELSDLYSKSLLTIIPLKESLQPSGQSVALQSIACGTPVVITKTEGFWDTNNFKNNENIFFVNSNNLDDWIFTINQIKNFSISEIRDLNIEMKKVITNYELDRFNLALDKVLNI